MPSYRFLLLNRALEDIKLIDYCNTRFLNKNYHPVKIKRIYKKLKHHLTYI